MARELLVCAAADQDQKDREKEEQETEKKKMLRMTKKTLHVCYV